MVKVVAAILSQPDGSFLLARRPPGKPYAGYWEFPGGKIEADETPAFALSRELFEELGITVSQATPWIARVFVYPHATVSLQFYRVTAWQGNLTAREQQQLAWQKADSISVSPLLPANLPILRGLALPAIYVITNATETGETQSLKTIERALASGVRMLQIREKTMPRDQLTDYARKIMNQASAYQAKVLVNGDISNTPALHADGVHLTSTQLISLTSRPSVNWCGASCHNEAELYHAEKLGIDFVTLSPVRTTLSHPNNPALGWQKFSALIRGYSLPVYALGGLTLADLSLAQEHGAHGIALMRHI